MDVPEITLQIGVVLAVLAVTILLFVTEVVRVDVAAVIVMVTLGALSYVPGLEGIVDVNHLFDGFASNAVIAIIAVMIIGSGLDRTGLMSRLAGWILRVGGSTEKQIIPMISGTVGVISSFMQNVGAAALFLPVVSRISSRTDLPMSRLLMPMGFCAILGGTMTMVGSSPLILLNDLIIAINMDLQPDTQIRTFGLFDVTPIGLALVATGILYFVLLGPFVLPVNPQDKGATGESLSAYFKRIYGLHGDIFEVDVPAGSPLEGKDLQDLYLEYYLTFVAIEANGATRVEPPRDTRIDGPVKLAVMGSEKAVMRFADRNGLEVSATLDSFAEDLTATRSGIAELVIPVDSKIVGKTPRELWMRKTYGLGPMAIHRGGVAYNRMMTDEGAPIDIYEIALQPGDTLVCHTTWEALARLESDRNFVIVTADYPREQIRPKKVPHALLFFGLALALILFTDVRLSLALLVGALGMILSGVLSIDEAYEAVSWKTVFLLASLIPLGMAVHGTGTAEWIALHVLNLLGDVPGWVLQTALAILTTLFTLVMSNVGATVLLVPLAAELALRAGADPALFVLTVGIATSNSFLIPTHQVNALIMGPAGYRVADFIRSGGIMTLLFLIVSGLMLNLVY